MGAMDAGIDDKLSGKQGPREENGKGAGGLAIRHSQGGRPWHFRALRFF
jgi:hypothetical protein